jgi:putative SOS response-associated peptidase YedK
MRTDGTVLTALETLAMCSRTVLLAGIWTRFDRPRLRVESYSIITRLHDVAQGLRSVIMLSSSEAKLWLDPDSSETELEGIVGVRTQESRRRSRGVRREKGDAQHSPIGLAATG